MITWKTEGPAVIWCQEQIKKYPKAFAQKIYLKFTSGFPDLVVVAEHVTAFYECKLFRKDIIYSLKQFEPLQIATMQKIEAAGGYANGLILKNSDDGYLVDWTDKLRPRVAELDCLWQRLQRDPLNLQNALEPYCQWQEIDLPSPRARSLP